MLIPEILNEIDFIELEIREKVHFFRCLFQITIWKYSLEQGNSPGWPKFSKKCKKKYSFFCWIDDRSLFDGLWLLFYLKKIVSGYYFKKNSWKNRFFMSIG